MCIRDRDRFANKVYVSNKYLCFQHSQIFEKNNVLPFGFYDSKKEAELMKQNNK